MKKILQSSTFLLLSWCLLLVGMQQARASHIQGGQLTYTNVGLNQYVFTLYLYRDCSGSTLPTDMYLIGQRGCNGITVPGMPPGSSNPFVAPGWRMAPVANSIAVGTQYCASQQQFAQCNTSASLPNYQTQQYRTATITVAPGQWLFSTEICCRPSTANLVGQATFRYEATLNNQVTVNGQLVTIQNNSPQYSAQDVPVPFVPVNQQTTIGFNTNDPDNTRLNPNTDSLVYSLTTPLDACNSSIAYQPYPSAMPVPHPTIPGCYIFPPATNPTVFTAALPIAVGFQTTGTCPALTGVPNTNQFSFNASAGQFTFTPNQYFNTAPVNGDNKYVVVGRVDDYRRLPGSNRRYLVGSVRREIFIVVNNSPNTPPSAPTGTPVTPGAGTTVVTTVDSLDVTIQPCNYSQVLVRFTDPDPGQTLTVSYTGVGTIPVDVLQSGDIGTYTLTGNGTTAPVARFLFQPSPAFSGQVLRIPFQIKDNACPVQGLQTRILIVRIASTRRDLATTATVTGASGLGNTNIASICLGGSLTLRGTVTRPDSTRGRLQTYNYRWTGNGIAGRADTSVVVVHPTITTRYRLDVNPVGGFQTGVCSDTSSILVRVVPAPTVAVVASNTTVCPGSNVTLTATASRATDALTDNYTYSWTGPGVPANTTGSSITVTPAAAGTYTVVARGDARYACEATNQISLSVAPAAVADFNQTAAISSRPGSRSLIPPVTFKFANNSSLNPNNAAFQLDSVRWTYQRVKSASGEPVTSVPVRFSNSRTEATTPALEPGYYDITLTVSTRAAGTNCPPNSVTKTVFVPNTEVPNIITPNGDNFNDYFVVNSDQYGGKLEIFNRWGRKVQDYGKYTNNWNGEGQPDGVYYYYLTDKGGNKTKGWIEVVRGGN
jgi:gliding motility-associated-like protein